MSRNNIFDLKRLFLLLRRQVFSNLKNLLIAFGGVSGFLLFITLLVAFFNPDALAGLSGLYFSVMFVGGYIFTSNIYAELHSIQRSYNYLTLPVSVTERLVSGWLITGVLFPIASLLTMTLIVLLSNLIIHFAIDISPVQGVFSSNGMNAWKSYLITQSVFLLGAAYFRKNNFLKTILALFLIVFVLNVYTGLLGWALLGFKDGFITLNEHTISSNLENIFTNLIPSIFTFIYHWLVIPFFLITTWFALKERQV